MNNHKENYGTYEDDNTWITPLGDYNIIHYDCPTEHEIKQRVADSINEIVSGDEFDKDCPLCVLMAKEPYDINYYCTVFCHECPKAKICKNFDPNSREEEKEIMKIAED
jgi:hypothetical protein